MEAVFKFGCSLLAYLSMNTKISVYVHLCVCERESIVCTRVCVWDV